MGVGGAWYRLQYCALLLLGAGEDFERSGSEAVYESKGADVFWMSGEGIELIVSEKVTCGITVGLAFLAASKRF